MEEMQGVSLVTGATGGIGTEIARGLLAHGADVIITTRDARRGNAVREALAAGAHGSVDVLPLDVADQSSIRALARTVTERHPGWTSL